MLIMLPEKVSPSTATQSFGIDSSRMGYPLQLVDQGTALEAPRAGLVHPGAGATRGSAWELQAPGPRPSSYRLVVSNCCILGVCAEKGVVRSKAKNDNRIRGVLGHLQGVSTPD